MQIAVTFIICFLGTVRCSMPQPQPIQRSNPNSIHPSTLQHHGATSILFISHPETQSHPSHPIPSTFSTTVLHPSKMDFFPLNIISNQKRQKNGTPTGTVAASKRISPNIIGFLESGFALLPRHPPSEKTTLGLNSQQLNNKQPAHNHWPKKYHRFQIHFAKSFATPCYHAGNFLIPII